MLQCTMCFRIYILWRIFFICLLFSKKLFLKRSESFQGLLKKTPINKSYFIFILAHYSIAFGVIIMLFWRHHRVSIWKFGFTTFKLSLINGRIVPEDCLGEDRKRMKWMNSFEIIMIETSGGRFTVF